MKNGAVTICALATMLATIASGAPRSGESAMNGLDSEKKVIAFGWDTGDRTVEEIARYADEIAKMGIDGVAITMAYPEIPEGAKRQVPRKWQSIVYGKEPWNETEKLLQIIPAVKAASSGSLTHNFILCTLFFKQREAFEDDEFWSAACEKIALVAKIAKEGGTRGIMIDVEDYSGAGQFYWHPTECAHDYDETAPFARRRGKELMEAVAKEFPDCEVLTTWLLSNQSRKSLQDTTLGIKSAAKFNGDLFIPFMAGLVEGLAPEMELIDGNEAGYFREASHREFFYDYFLMRQRGELAMPPELRVKYQTQVKTSFGLYLDSYPKSLENNGWHKGEMDGNTTRHFELNFRQALECADKYVWLFGERYAFANWSDTLSQVNIWPHWEEGVPGISDAIKSAKDLQGYGEEVYQAILKSGKTPAVVSSFAADFSTVTNKSGNVYTAPKGWLPDFGRPRKDGFTPTWEFLPTGGHGGTMAMKQSGTFAASLSFGAIPKVEKGALYRFSLWIKSSESLIPIISAAHATKEHPIWNDGLGWMSLGAKKLGGNSNSQISTAEPDADGWREYVIYFRGEPFDTMVTLSASCPRRFFDGDFCIYSDPKVEKLSDAVKEKEKSAEDELPLDL